MLSDVPLERLLEGMATALHDRVEPALDDEFALMQVRATVELLRNLAGRTEWSVRERADEATDRAALIDRLHGAGWPGGPDGSLTDALAWAEGANAELRRAVTAYLRTLNKAERARLKSGMYG